MMAFAEFKKLIPTLTLEQLRSWWNLLHMPIWEHRLALTDKEWFSVRRMIQRRITTNLSGSVSPKEGN